MQNILHKIFEIAVWVQGLIEEKAGEKQGSSMNSSGDTQKPLDIMSDILVEKHLRELSEIQKLVSEEREEVMNLNDSGRYFVAYDPLDGSSLIDVNLSVGSIFGIYENDFAGNDIVAACYIVYGPRLEVVWADSSGVKFFRKIGEEFVEQGIQQLQEKWKILAPGSKHQLWPEYQKELVAEFWKDGYTLRYSGGMVPDLHQIILKRGGLFCYPETKWNPQGKLRKLFEVFPFAYIFEQLGWDAIDNTGKRILDNGYTKIHESIPCYFGSNSEIKKVQQKI